MPVTEPKVLQDELAKFGEFANISEARELALIRALCRALEQELLSYYQRDDAPENRLRRLGEISLMFRGTKFKVGKASITTAAPGVTAKTNISGAEAMLGYGCPPGTTCIDGNCVPDFVEEAESALASLAS